MRTPLLRTQYQCCGTSGSSKERLHIRRQKQLDKEDKGIQARDSERSVCGNF